ncbi:MAG: hypothetical protein ACPG4U_01055 [Pseudomonadales bacterium]
MTDSTLDQLELHIDALLAHCEKLERENADLRNRLDQSQRVGSERYNELIQRCASMEIQHQEMSETVERLSSREQQAQAEKQRIANLNLQTRNQVEKMIARLKTLEQNA